MVGVEIETEVWWVLVVKWDKSRGFCYCIIVSISQDQSNYLARSS